MKNLRILAAATLFSLASIAILSGCGPSDLDQAEKDGTACTSATSCGDGYICSEWDANAKKGKCRVDCANAAGNAPDQSKCEKPNYTCTERTAQQQDANGNAVVDSKGKPVTKKRYSCDPSAAVSQNACKTDGSCDDGKVCDDSDPNNKVCVDSCKSNQQMCGDYATCGGTGLCVNKTFRTVVIKDVSTAEEAQCKDGNKTDAGSDIVAVVLKKSSTGDILGYGKALDEIAASVAATGTNYHNLNFPDGGAPTIKADNCIIDSLQHSTGRFNSIGCGGGLILNFKLDNNEEITFSKGNVIDVYEYSSNSCAKSKPSSPTPEDKYEVYVCESNNPGNSWSDISQNCIKISGDSPLEGYGSVTVGPTT